MRRNALRLLEEREQERARREKHTGTAVRAMRLLEEREKAS